MDSRLNLTSLHAGFLNRPQGNTEASRDDESKRPRRHGLSRNIIGADAIAVIATQVEICWY